MRSIDIEDGYLTDLGRRRFGLQRAGLYLVLVAGVIAVSVGIYSTMLALKAARNSMNDRLAIVQAARQAEVGIRKQLLQQIEGDVQLDQGRSDEDRQATLGRLHQLWELQEREAKLTQEPLKIEGDVEALTLVTSHGKRLPLNASKDGRLVQIPQLTTQELESLGAAASRRAEQELAETPEQILARDIDRINREVQARVAAQQAAQPQP